MLGAVKGEKTRSQLTDAAQPLKFPGIDEIPDRLILHIDILVNRIFKHFFFFHRLLHGIPPRNLQVLIDNIPPKH